MSAQDRINQFLLQMSRMTLPEEEFEGHGYESADDFIADLDDERLCGEYTTFMEMVREAREIVKELG